MNKEKTIITKGDFTFTIPNYEKLAGFKTSTYQLLDAIIIALTITEVKSPTVIISLEEYMQRRSLKDRKEAKRQVKADIEILRQASITVEENQDRGNKKETVPYSFVNIADSGEVRRNGDIVFTFKNTFYQMLLNYPIMPYPSQLHTVNNKRNPNSYYLLRKIAEHKNMNIGKENENIIAVKTLLAVAPFIPSYDEVMKTDRHINRKIIGAFERDMNVLNETLRWNYCYSNGEQLKDDKLKSLTYNLFVSLFIKINWKRYLDQIVRFNKKDPVEPQHTHKNKKPIITYELFSEYIENHGYSIKYNQISHNFDFFGFDEKSKEHLAETVPIILHNQMKQLYQGINKLNIVDYITLYATRHTYNPILDLIKATKWDGKDRVSQVYDIFKISTDTKEGIYSRKYILKAFKQCICGLFNNFDNPFSLDITLIFKGNQGIGKTRFLEKLALNTKYFGEGVCLDLHNKDSIIQSTSKWICELSELSFTTHSNKDIDSLKAFLTKSTDEYRLPYERTSLHYPRITTFFGTINNNQFLNNQTGNKRFIIIPLAPDLMIDYETQIKPFNALQLWSQIYSLVKDEDKASCFRLTTEDRQYLDNKYL